LVSLMRNLYFHQSHSPFFASGGKADQLVV
jgi:hypothetical protein